jgi:transposase
MNESQLLSELLGLPNIRVQRYQLQGSNDIELTIDSTAEAGVCPSCGQVSQVRHEQGERQAIRDLSMWNRQCILQYAPYRFRCERCQATFVERVVWRTAGVSYTVRYEQALYERVRRESIAQVARDEGLSEDTVQAIFLRWAKKRSKRGGIRS